MYENQINYCYRCWNEFTTLTAKELSNLEEIRIQKALKEKPIKNTKPSKVIYCRELNMFFNNTLDAERVTKVNRHTIYRIIHGKNTRESTYTFEWREFGCL